MKDYLEDSIATAIGDPGSVVGRKLGPSWGRGNEGYAGAEETVPRWATRAVLATLKKEGRLLPPGGRMATFQPGGDGRPTTAVIHLDGPQSTFRFAVNMLSQQCDIYSAGRAILVDLRDHMTPDRFDPMAKSLLGDERYAKLAGYFERSWSCASCEKDIRIGHRYAPTEDAGAVCAACCKGFPDYVARLAKRAPEPVPVPV